MATFRGGYSLRAYNPPGGNITPDSGLYFNSYEVRDVRTVLTDDFDRGNWYVIDSDHPPNYQITPPGWGGTIFANPITPAGAARNLAAIGKKPLFTDSDWVATTGFLDGTVNQKNNAWHNLSGAQSAGYDEIYIRYYTYHVEANFYGASNPSQSYLWGNQKHVTVNRFGDTGGIYWFATGFNIGAGPGDSQSTTCVLNQTNNHGSNTIQHQGANFIAFQPGHWYYVETYVKLNTSGSSDGLYKLWINDGGSNGDFSGQSPILRADHSGLDYGYNVATEPAKIGALWLENWSPEDVDPSLATIGEQFWTNIHVKAGAGSMVGFNTRRLP